jgi:hypothetical protein
MPVKERPILFSGPMVRALLDGRKTQTRRTVKLPTKGEYIRPDMGGWSPSTIGGADQHGRSVPEHVCLWNQTTGTTLACPYGVPGDRLWVREAWAVKRFEHCLAHERDWQELCGATVRYLADGAEIVHRGDRATGRGIYRGPVEKGRPSIHMPRWASRLTLEITEVRVERLQDISQADAKSEGCDPIHMQPGGPTGDPSAGWICYRAGFESLWNHINGPDSWDANPWVWAVSFRVLEQGA